MPLSEEEFLAAKKGYRFLRDYWAWKRKDHPRVRWVILFILIGVGVLRIFMGPTHLSWTGYSIVAAGIFSAIYRIFKERRSALGYLRWTAYFQAFEHAYPVEFNSIQEEQAQFERGSPAFKGLI